MNLEEDSQNRELEKNLKIGYRIQGIEHGEVNVYHSKKAYAPVDGQRGEVWEKDPGEVRESYFFRN